MSQSPDSVVQPGEKFGAVVLSGAWIEHDFTAPVYLGNDHWILSGTPFGLQAHWKEWIGSIRADAIGEANLWCISKMPSATPDVVDQENTTLRERAYLVWYALLLQTPIAYEQGFHLTGANQGRGPEARQFGDLVRFYITEDGIEEPSLGNAEVANAAEVLAGLTQITTDDQFMRVRAGIIVFLRGLMREYVDRRVHQFVRSLEGIIKPEIGSSKKQFVHRAQTFAGAGKAQQEILSECYDLRSQVEHLHSWENALPHIPAGQRLERLKAHHRHMEALCRHVYVRISLSPSHRTLFADGNIDAFWQRPDHEKRASWGPSLDVTTVR